MPVTARLSKKFDDTLGEDIANELVDWFNQVDATYRSELRDLNELNFARFEAKLEQRIAEVKADIAVLHGKVESQVDALSSKMDTQAESMRAELIKWMFLFWLGTVATMLMWSLNTLGAIALLPMISHRLE